MNHHYSFSQKAAIDRAGWRDCKSCPFMCFGLLFIRVLDNIYAMYFSTFKSHRQINLELDSDDVQELLDSHNQELTIDEVIEMHEQKQDIEKH
ncbi:hypothetical protein TNCV_4367481 [Trichonephila clavipes]|nr:hypothetical protein TNCV_4367481 [Trichonephila clavipes]